MVGVDLFHVAANREWYRGLVHTLMNLRVSQKSLNFLNIWANVGCRRGLCYAELVLFIECDHAAIRCSSLFRNTCARRNVVTHTCVTSASQSLRLRAHVCVCVWVCVCVSVREIIYKWIGVDWYSNKVNLMRSDM